MPTTQTFLTRNDLLSKSHWPHGLWVRWISAFRGRLGLRLAYFMVQGLGSKARKVWSESSSSWFGDKFAPKSYVKSVLSHRPCTGALQTCAGEEIKGPAQGSFRPVQGKTKDLHRGVLDLCRGTFRDLCRGKSALHRGNQVVRLFGQKYFVVGICCARRPAQGLFRPVQGDLEDLHRAKSGLCWGINWVHPNSRFVGFSIWTVDAQSPAQGHVNPAQGKLQALHRAVSALHRGHSRLAGRFWHFV